MEQHTFTAEEQLVVDQSALVIIGEIDVVEVDPTADLEAGHDLEDQPIDLAPWLDRVRGIDKEQALVVQVREDFPWHVLGPGPYQFDPSVPGASREEPGRERLDANQLWPVPGVFGGQQHDGRRTRRSPPG